MYPRRHFEGNAATTKEKKEITLEASISEEEWDTEVGLRINYKDD